ncbi:baseplate J/gp47 family protein [Pseudovibrio brasiliensis]|uniref:Baseplate J/gp47 family protein n=1 Tax=Pseudovibrio brasiliensis TaxID=1898042 RepID=A0ABX8AYE9_9HYPH|nr:baseplate J/gp47 family protein [Pseudovibrio brasiliensis]QUS59207.1 baseplate J/gp47 family protein [Pseudovibrio brasiliensis]
MNLPEPTIIEELSPERIYQEIKDIYASYNPDFKEIADLETTPEAKTFQAFSYREFHLRQRINDVFKSYLIEYAEGVTLHHLGAFYGLSPTTGESDERFKKRLKLAIAGRSAAGPKERYKALCLDADVRVRDVNVWSSALDPTVNIAVLSSDPGGIASQDLLDTVATYIDHPERRVTSDEFKVSSAVKKVVNVTLSVQLEEFARNSAGEELEANLRAAWDAEDLLGLDLTRAWLIRNAMGNGINNVKVEQPFADVVAEPNEAIGLGTINVIISGRGR